MLEAYTEKRVVLDGGQELHLDSRRNTIYYWFDPDTGGVLYHTGVNRSEADPFFGSVGEAETFLYQQAGQAESDQYSKLSLYSAKIQKIEDAVDVLMNQSGIDDF